MLNAIFISEIPATQIAHMTPLLLTGTFHSHSASMQGRNCFIWDEV